MPINFDPGSFLGDTLELGKEFALDAAEFARDLSLEDIATVGTLGLSAAQFLRGPEEPAGVEKVKTAGDALAEGAKISQSASQAPDIRIGDTEDPFETNEEATQNRLRVRRQFDVGARLGSDNPLAIQI